jgi:hypothetical protein
MIQVLSLISCTDSLRGHSASIVCGRGMKQIQRQAKGFVGHEIVQTSNKQCRNDNGSKQLFVGEAKAVSGSQDIHSHKISCALSCDQLSYFRSSWIVKLQVPNIPPS